MKTILEKPTTTDAGASAPEEKAELTMLQQVLEQMKKLQEDNAQLRQDGERLKAAMWDRAKPDDIQMMPIDPQDLKLCTVLYGYGKVGANERVWVGGAGGTTWEFIGGKCKSVPWSVAKHWVNSTRPDGKPVLSHIQCVVLPNDSTEADYAKAVGFEPMSVEETAAMIAAADFEKLADSLPKTTRELLIKRLQESTTK
jgi:hypothetical protein